MAAWVVGLVAAFGAAGLAGDWSADYSTPGSESRAAAALLQERFPQSSPDTVDVVWQAPDGAAAAVAQRRIARLTAAADRLEGVGRSPSAAEAERSRDGTIGVLRIPLTELPGAIPTATGEQLIELRAAPGRSPHWAPALASMLGIGVGIDYALLIVTRYRGALAGGSTPRAAVAEAVTTAGRSVLIAGTTVVISLVGLFLMGLPYLYGAALATIIAVLVVMAASVTLVPALLAMAGSRIDRLRIPGANRPVRAAEATLAARWGRAVQRRPWVAAVAGTAVLLVLASPSAGLRLGFPDRGNDAADTTTRQAYDLVSEGFGPGANGPLLLAAPAADQADRDAMAALAARLREEPGVAAVAAPASSPDGSAVVLSVTPRTSPQDPATEDLIAHLRDDVLPGAGVDVQLGGATAAFMDQSQATADRLRCSSAASSAFRSCCCCSASAPSWWR